MLNGSLQLTFGHPLQMLKKYDVDSGVIVGTEDNFASILKDFKYIVVDFCLASWLACIDLTLPRRQSNPSVRALRCAEGTAVRMHCSGALNVCSPSLRRLLPTSRG